MMCLSMDFFGFNFVWGLFSCTLFFSKYVEFGPAVTPAVCLTLSFLSEIDDTHFGSFVIVPQVLSLCSFSFSCSNWVFCGIFVYNFISAFHCHIYSAIESVQ